jgi:ABC-type glycerol-3-phosphate transport system substrate-binding protein
MIRVGCALVALAVLALMAGCGGDDDSGDDSAQNTATTVTVPGTAEAAALQEQIADLSDEEQVTLVGEEWADLFGKEDEAMCGYLHADIAGSCTLFVEGALTGSTEL